MSYRSRFFNKRIESLTLKEVCDLIGASVDQNLEKIIFDIATLKNGGPGEISFISNASYLADLENSKVEFCLIEEKFVSKLPKTIIPVIHKNPYFAYSQIAGSFYKAKIPDFKEGNLISPLAKIGKNCQIAPNAYIGDDVEIGDNCFIGPSVSIMSGCVIGDNTIINAGSAISFTIIGKNCIIHNNCSIGQDGFGYAHDSGVNHKIIQLGAVEIVDNIEIGAGTCIDRGAIENTKIGEGVKIDNLVQIAHNVEIGKGSVLAGCCAVAGSTKVGNYVQIGGKAATTGHITIGDGAKIAGMSGVTRSVEAMQTVGGYPAMPIRIWHKINAKLLRMTKS